MSKLTSHERNALPSSDFGLPDKDAYPMPDKSHARNALARASEMYKKGKLNDREYRQIRNKAHAKLRSAGE